MRTKMFNLRLLVQGNINSSKYMRYNKVFDMACIDII